MIIWKKEEKMSSFDANRDVLPTPYYVTVSQVDEGLKSL